MSTFLGLILNFKVARHNVFKYAVENLNQTVVKEKFDLFINNLKCKANMTLAFGLILKKIKHGILRYFHAHGIITLLDPSNFVRTMDKLTTLKEIVKETDASESCSGERLNR